MVVALHVSRCIAGSACAAPAPAAIAIPGIRYTLTVGLVRARASCSAKHASTMNLAAQFG